KPRLPENYQEVTWEKLSEAVVAIQTSRPIQYSLEDLYQAVQNMCNHNMSSVTYTNLTTYYANMVTHSHYTSCAWQRVIETSFTNGSEAFLRHFNPNSSMANYEQGTRKRLKKSWRDCLTRSWSCFDLYMAKTSLKRSTRRY
ncbi:unnamed protein product, partial [Nesidiocoris tenuis]